MHHRAASAICVACLRRCDAPVSHAGESRFKVAAPRAVRLPV